MANEYAKKTLRQENARLKELRDAVVAKLADVNARRTALQSERDAYDAQITENQAAIALLGG